MVDFSYVALGLVAGVLSGLFGIGGGIILIPAFVYIFGFKQHQAQGTTLALMVLPIGILAALRYYYGGNVKLGVEGLVCLGFILGGLIGAHFAQGIPDSLLRKGFGIFMLAVSLRMIF